MGRLKSGKRELKDRKQNVIATATVRSGGRIEVAADSLDALKEMVASMEQEG